MSKPLVSSAELLLQPLRDTPLDQVADLFLGEAKPESQWFLGLELELFGFHREDLSPLGHETISRLLEGLGNKNSMRFEREPSGALVGLSGEGRVVSLEPGGQIELATSPRRRLKALRDEVMQYCWDLLEVANPERVGFWAIGHHPFSTRESIPKMPKARYEIMRDYFAQRGARALDMMHLTGSVQCAVDFTDGENLANKIRTAVRASPFIAALTAASPFTAGKPNGFKTIRYQIWLETDDERCGIWPEMVDEEGLTVSRYLERAVKTPVLFFMRDGVHRPAEPKPFAHYIEHGFEDTEVTVADLIDHLTTFFPEVRPKGYIELRGSDCLTPPGAVAVAGFWRAILDDEETRRAVDERLAAMSYEALRELQPQVARAALDATSPAGPVGEVAAWLIEAAYERLRKAAPDCAECLEQWVEMARAHRTIADMLLERAEKTSIAEALQLVEVSPVPRCRLGA